MSFQYNFTHTCGHTGIGPLMAHSTPLPTNIIPLTLPFACPFCLTPNHTVPEGSGLLCILPPTYPPYTWHILRSCNRSDISPNEWGLCMPPGGGFRQIAWIPRPVGEVRANGGVEGRDGVVGVVTGVRSVRRERLCNGKVVSQLPGLASQLGAVVRAGERAGR
jgi:hypothetical protein